MSNAITAAHLQHIAEMTVKLTEMRQKDCSHLCVENFAPEIFGKLLLEFYKSGNTPVNVMGEIVNRRAN